MYIKAASLESFNWDARGMCQIALQSSTERIGVFTFVNPSVNKSVHAQAAVGME